VITVTNGDGRAFGVRVVLQGERYGLDDCLTHGDADPTIEFYDHTYADAPGFGPRGQFVSRYYLRTLLDHGERYGLTLDGGVKEWHVSAANVQRALGYAQGLVESAG
jgi:hypothetical protein